MPTVPTSPPLRPLRKFGASMAVSLAGGLACAGWLAAVSDALPTPIVLALLAAGVSIQAYFLQRGPIGWLARPAIFPVRMQLYALFLLAPVLDTLSTLLVHRGLVDARVVRVIEVAILMVAIDIGLRWILARLQAVADAGQAASAQVAGALRASEQRFRSVTQSASDPIVSTDRDGTIVFWNGAAERAFGWSEVDALGSSITRVIQPSMNGQFAGILADLTAGRSPSTLGVRTERTALRKDGTRFQVELALATWMDGPQRYFTSILRDVTERKAAEAQMQLMNERLRDANESLLTANEAFRVTNQQFLSANAQLLDAKEQADAANRYKSAFLANTSHEIRTPMNVLLGMIELLAGSKIDVNQAHLLQSARQAGEHLLAVVDDVLDFSKVGSGQLELEQIDFDVREVVEQAVEFFSHRAHQKRLALVVRVDDAVPGLVVGDPYRLRQVLINLIGNAVKFTRHGGVSVAVTATGDRMLRFQVSDTGIGIPPEKHVAVFEAFTQVDTSTTRQHGGTGLGLAISKGLVERMGGTITVESAPGKGAGSLDTEPGPGATFRFSVALSVRAVAKPAPQTDDDNNEFIINSLKRGAVLVADGHQMQRQAVAEGMARFSARVHEAGDVDAALHLLHHNGPYALLIVDTRLPGGGGLGLVQAMQAQTPEPWPGVVLAREDEDSLDVSRMQRAGVLSTLRKPVKRTALATAVAAALAGPTESPAATGVPPAQVPATDRDDMRLRVLLVEDAPDNRLLVRAFLRDQGWQVDEACNGVEALAMWLPGQYDVVLMDVQMPVMDGYTATREIRRREQAAAVLPVPIVALTAHALPEAHQQSAEAGCTTHVTKPFRRGQLIDVVRSLAGAARARTPGGSGGGAILPAQPHAAPASTRIEVRIDAMLLPLAPDYLAHRREDVLAIRQAAASGDFAAMRLLGHSMRGSGESYGFQVITEIGAEIEAAAERKDSAPSLDAARRLEGYLRDVVVVAA